MRKTFRRRLTSATVRTVTALAFAAAATLTLGVGAATADTFDPCTPAVGESATCAIMASIAAPGTTPLGPADLRTVYGFQSATGGVGQTVAVVEAYHYASAASDLSAYRSNYGIASCTSASGCFRQVTWTGGTSFAGMSSAVGTGNDVADAASMDMISAVCPNCHILLVEANVDSIPGNASDGLGAAENEAVALGAGFIVNPWGAPEAAVGGLETGWDTSYFNHPGVLITAASEQFGASGITYPAASPDVIAVGGTDLTPGGSWRGYTETAWSGTGSGCSEFEAAQPWQTGTACAAQRPLNDISAAAASGAFGIAYDDSNYTPALTGGSGTAFSAAIVAAAYALDASATDLGDYPSAYLYAHPGNLRDITTSDGQTVTCQWGPSACNAGTGYDGPTGIGTYNMAFCAYGARPGDAVVSRAVPLTATGQTGCMLASTATTTTVAGQAIYLHARMTSNDTERAVNTANAAYLHSTVRCFDHLGNYLYGLGSITDTWDGNGNAAAYTNGEFIPPYPDTWTCDLTAENYLLGGAGHTYYVTVSYLDPALYDGGAALTTPLPNQYVAPGTTYANGDKVQVARISGATNGSSILATADTNLTTCSYTSDVADNGCPNIGLPNTTTDAVTVHLWAWQTVSATDSTMCPANTAAEDTLALHISAQMHHYTAGQTVPLTLVSSCGPNVVVKTEIENAAGGPYVEVAGAFTTVGYVY